MRDAIVTLLQTLPSHRELEVQETWAKIRCPVHAGGNERTPSFRIRLDPVRCGQHFCFGCGIHGGWRETVVVLGFDPATRFLSQIEATDAFSDTDEALMMGKRVDKKSKRTDYRENWPLQEKWRTIPGNLVRDVGGKMVFGGDGREPILRLPVMVRGKERGYIDCKIVALHDGFDYINSSDARGWSKDVLFPYDFVRDLEPEVLAIVEGPRDALVTIRNGLPALATLGSTSWNSKCANLVKAIAPKKLIIMADPDVAGEKLQKKVHRDLVNFMDISVVVLPSKMVEGKRIKLLDPADLNRRKLGIIFDKIKVKLPDMEELRQYRKGV